MSVFWAVGEMVYDIAFGEGGIFTAKGINDHEIEGPVGWHFGFYSRPKDGPRGLVLKLGGEGNSSILVAFRDKQYELTLEKGECGMKNAFDASILLDKDGNITQVAKSGAKVKLGAASGNQPAVLGDNLETRLADLESKFLAHTHTTALGACTAGGATGAVASAPTTATLPHSGDDIKSDKVEVAP